MHLCWKKAVAMLGRYSNQLRIIEHIMAIVINIIATKAKSKRHGELLLALNR
jgi:hypothetical protein